jgi:amino acid transporter
MWTLTGCECAEIVRGVLYLTDTPDDSAAHIAEEVSGAQRAAPIAILVGVFGTQVLGWLLYIACSFATVSVANLLTGSLPLPMGQLFLDVLGKRGMLAIWGFIIVVQVRPKFLSMCFRMADE